MERERGDYRRHCAVAIFVVLLLSAGINLNASGGSISSRQESSAEDIPSLLARFAGMLEDSLHTPECESLYELLSDRYSLAIPSDSSLAISFCRYLGYYTYRHSELEASLNYYGTALRLYEKKQVLAPRDSAGLATVLYQLGLSQSGLGDPESAVESLSRSLEIRKVHYGESSINVVRVMQQLASNLSQAGSSERAKETIIKAISIAEESTLQSLKSMIGSLYYTFGTIYIDTRNFNDANLMYSIALDNQLRYDHDDGYQIMLIYNGMGVAYTATNDTLKTVESYLNAIEYIEKNSYFGAGASAAFSNLGYYLSRIGREEEGAGYLQMAYETALAIHGPGAEATLVEYENLAFYQFSVLNRLEISAVMYQALLDSVASEKYSIKLVKDIKSGNAQLQAELGHLEASLAQYRSLFEYYDRLSDIDRVDILTGRSSVSYKIFRQGGDLDMLRSALDDMTGAIAIIDSLKLQLKEESGRSFLGSRYNFQLQDAVRMAADLYLASSEKVWLRKAFELSEKSKAFSLLAATRESKAIKFHIPEELAEEEKRLERRLSDLTGMIYTARNSQSPDEELISTLQLRKKEVLLKRDSLVDLFKQSYPDYYRLNQFGAAASCGEVSRYLGRGKDFIEYFMGDSSIFVFHINHRDCRLSEVPYTPELSEAITGFRSDLTKPAIENGSRAQFQRLTSNGYIIYRELIEPLEEQFVSDHLVIAADGLLSYLPFETLVADTCDLEPLNYRAVPFLFKEYDINYVYSATILMETGGTRRKLRNPALVFAPEYSGNIEVDSLMLTRQKERGPLKNIPGAREEAIYVSSILGGRLFLDSEATEERFVAESESGRVIHLAMHTLMNDTDPMYSRMVFALDSDTIREGLLNTFEVYNLSLEAVMVVLSSCNTGTGLVQTGEGIISLARGFMYAGTPSVLMSLWEVDDHSGSEIMKLFYHNLKSGKSKSRALRRAREEYLAVADQHRSHPYYWCSVVILGDDSALFLSRPVAVILTAVGALVILAAAYLLRPKSS